MSIILQDVINQANDYLTNYTTGSIDTGNRMRAANRACEWLKAKLTLPSDKTIYRFYYSQDQMYYDLPSSFNEPLLLIYDDENNNKPINNWSYRIDTDILERSGLSTSRKMWSTTTINGKKQAILYGTNLYQGTNITTFDSISGITVSGDANSLSLDTTTKYEGSGSARFTITPSSGTASIKWTPAISDWRTLVANNAFLKMRIYMPSVAFSSINLKIGSSLTDYYTFTATLKDDGTPFTTNSFNLISWKFSDNPVMAGSVNTSAINFCQLDFVESGFGSSPVSNFRIDNFYYTVPDYMDLIYITNIKGTDGAGNSIQMFTEGSDIPAFSSIAPDLLNVMALRMAYILYPQIKKDTEFWNLYNSECAESVKMYGRIYPRQRIVNLGKTHLNR